jgi:hypothetical protein
MNVVRQGARVRAVLWGHHVDLLIREAPVRPRLCSPGEAGAERAAQYDSEQKMSDGYASRASPGGHDLLAEAIC